jgi:hypothetical protein
LSIIFIRRAVEQLSCSMNRPCAFLLLQRRMANRRGLPVTDGTGRWAGQAATKVDIKGARGHPVQTPAGTKATKPAHVRCSLVCRPLGCGLRKDTPPAAGEGGKTDGASRCAHAGRHRTSGSSSSNNRPDSRGQDRQTDGQQKNCRHTLGDNKGTVGCHCKFRILLDGEPACPVRPLHSLCCVLSLTLFQASVLRRKAQTEGTPLPLAYTGNNSVERTAVLLSIVGISLRERGALGTDHCACPSCSSSAAPVVVCPTTMRTHKRHMHTITATRCAHTQRLIGTRCIGGRRWKSSEYRPEWLGQPPFSAARCVFVCH